MKCLKALQMVTDFMILWNWHIFHYIEGNQLWFYKWLETQYLILEQQWCINWEQSLINFKKFNIKKKNKLFRVWMGVE